MSDIIYCSFCGKNQQQVKSMIAGPNVNICVECVELCHDIAQEEAKKEIALEDLSSPHNIKKFLDKHVIGQDELKKTVSVALHNHFKRLKNALSPEPTIEIQKSNILIAGPSGTGKTHTLRTFAKAANMPFVEFDASTLTEAGYVGANVDEIIERLLNAADGNPEKAEKGIVFIDEIDKLRKKNSTNTAGRRGDVGGQSAQEALLAMLEGKKITLNPGKGRSGIMDFSVQGLEIDTSNILFVVSGAFEGLDKIVKHRLTSETAGAGHLANFNNKSTANPLIHYDTSDLIEFGMIPEFVGRFPILTHTDPLDLDDLKRVLTEPVSSLVKQQQILMEMSGIKLNFTDCALNLIAQKALERKTGARALQSVMSSIEIPLAFRANDGRNPLSEIQITAEMVENPSLIEYPHFEALIS